MVESLAEPQDPLVRRYALEREIGRGVIATDYLSRDMRQRWDSLGANGIK
jgi:hypothetical protein